MTPKQFHFPLFFNLEEFNAHLAPSGWICRMHEDRTGASGGTLEIVPLDPPDSQVPSNIPVTVKSYEFLMVQEHRLYIWKKFENGLLIRQYSLAIQPDVGKAMEEFIPIMPLRVGQQFHKTQLVYDHFITYIRKPNLPQSDPQDEQYVVVHIHGDQLTIIPMTEFNATGGDPMYVWPVLASYEPSSDTLYGYGMRMGSFSFSLGLTF